MDNPITADLTPLDAAILRGLADGAAGRTSPADEVFDELEARYIAMAEARRPK
ncbi:hypothetical protein [Tistrella mobilis]|uniref:hypothetical protein n=1 Tax=Tistrella mobilis TaxID=171437 RepID=UPI003556249D